MVHLNLAAIPELYESRTSYNLSETPALPIPICALVYWLAAWSEGAHRVPSLSRQPGFTSVVGRDFGCASVDRASIELARARHPSFRFNQNGIAPGRSQTLFLSNVLFRRMMVDRRGFEPGSCRTSFFLFQSSGIPYRNQPLFLP